MSTTDRIRPSTAAQAVMFVATACAMLGNYYVYDSIGPVADLLVRGLGFSNAQLGQLNGIYNLPNIFMVLIGGVLVDRFKARTVTVVTASVCMLGAVVTAVGGDFLVMAAGRLLFGLGAETMIVAITVGLAQWFAGRYFATFFAVNLSVARVGSWLADRSPSFAGSLYEQGWQPPLWLASGFAALALAGSVAYWLVDRREAGRGTLALAPPGDRIHWRVLLQFRPEYWLIVGLCVAFYAAILSFRSTFAIMYFQHAHGLELKAASDMNSHVFFAAIFATPVFGLLVDRVGRHATLMIVGSLFLPLSFVVLGATSMDLMVPTVLLGVTFSLVPAVLWPAVPRYVPAEHLGTAYGVMTMLQNAGWGAANVTAGYLNDAGGASANNPAGYDTMLWFFGLLSLLGVVCAVMLKLRDRRATA
jgi:MFS family permease